MALGQLLRSHPLQRCAEPYRPPCVPLQLLQPREWRNLQRRTWNRNDQTWDHHFLRLDVLFLAMLLVGSAPSNLLNGNTLKIKDVIIAKSVGVLHGGSPSHRSCPISPGDLQPWASCVRCGLETNNCKNRWVDFFGGVWQPGLSCEKFNFRCYTVTSCIRSFRPSIAPKMHSTTFHFTRYSSAGLDGSQWCWDDETLQGMCATGVRSCHGMLTELHWSHIAQHRLRSGFWLEHPWR